MNNIKRILKINPVLLVLAAPTVALVVCLFPFVMAGLGIVFHYVSKEDTTEVELGIAFLSMITLIMINATALTMVFLYGG